MIKRLSYTVVATVAAFGALVILAPVVHADPNALYNYLRCNETGKSNLLAYDYLSTRKLVIDETSHPGFYTIELRVDVDHFEALSRSLSLDLGLDKAPNYTRGTIQLLVPQALCQKKVLEEKFYLLECGAEAGDGALKDFPINYWTAVSEQKDEDAKKNIKSFSADLSFQVTLMSYYEAFKRFNTAYNAKIILRKNHGENATAESWPISLGECSVSRK